jgi:hypothetical protein
MSNLADHNEAMRAAAAAASRAANTRPPTMPPLEPLVAALDDTIAALVAERRLEIIKSLAQRTQTLALDVHTSLCGLSVDHVRLIRDLHAVRHALAALDEKADARHAARAA